MRRPDVPGLTRKTTNHLKVICPSPNLHFSDAGRAFPHFTPIFMKSLQASYFQIDYTPKMEELGDVGCQIIQMIANRITQDPDLPWIVIIVPLLPDDDLSDLSSRGFVSIDPVTNAPATNLMNLFAFTYNETQSPGGQISVVFYDASRDPPSSSSIGRRRLQVKSKSDRWKIMSRSQVLFHELAHIEYLYVNQEWIPWSHQLNSLNQLTGPLSPDQLQEVQDLQELIVQDKEVEYQRAILRTDNYRHARGVRWKRKDHTEGRIKVD